ncbi:MAG: hypothetical protein V1728_01515 [Candidatus Micrarchaeota archaeon]
MEKTGDLTENKKMQKTIDKLKASGKFDVSLSQDGHNIEAIRVFFYRTLYFGLDEEGKIVEKFGRFNTINIVLFGGILLGLLTQGGDWETAERELQEALDSK